eukprot:scaffold23107_cov167-Amphora_coffeaeformis.AAC.3
MVDILMGTLPNADDSGVFSSPSHELHATPLVTPNKHHMGCLLRHRIYTGCLYGDELACATLANPSAQHTRRLCHI